MRRYLLNIIFCLGFCLGFYPGISLAESFEKDLERYQLVSVGLLESLSSPYLIDKDNFFARFESTVAALPKLPRPKNSTTKVDSPQIYSLPKFAIGYQKDIWQGSLWYGQVNSSYIPDSDQGANLRFLQQALGASVQVEMVTFEAGQSLFFSNAFQYRWGRLQGEFIDQGIDSSMEHSARIWQLGLGMAGKDHWYWAYALLNGRSARSNIHLEGEGSLNLQAGDHGSQIRGQKLGMQLGVGLSLQKHWEFGLSEVVVPGLFHYPQFVFAMRL